MYFSFFWAPQPAVSAGTQMKQNGNLPVNVPVENCHKLVNYTKRINNAFSSSSTLLPITPLYTLFHTADSNIQQSSQLYH